MLWVKLRGSRGLPICGRIPAGTSRNQWIVIDGPSAASKVRDLNLELSLEVVRPLDRERHFSSGITWPAMNANVFEPAVHQL
jgi:hypothetical protein